MAANTKPVVVGITGASGSILGFNLVKQLLTLGVPVELVMTEKSHQVTFDELELKITGKDSAEKASQLVQYMGLPADTAGLLSVYPNHRLDAPPSSGTHLTRGMVVIPCSMGTLGKIAAAIGDNLVVRSADVTIKEARKLILVTRESPMSALHLRNQLTLAQLGVVILPPMLTFYLPDYHSMDGQISYVVGKVLDQLGLEHTCYARWGQQPQQL
jgi:flavin prenyltransferase